MKGKNVTPEFAKNVKILLDKGLEIRDIIAIMGCSAQTVYRIRNGVHPALYSKETKEVKPDKIKLAQPSDCDNDMLLEMRQIRSALYLIADQIKKLNDSWNQ